MIEYTRQYPFFSLCGLNCGLCPRFHTEGPSKCPGCGGPNFHLKHPSCPVITCAKKHDNVEYCFQCISFPCGRYIESSKVDSFISYRNVIRDLNRAKEFGIQRYQDELNQKIKILENLINHFNDGRKKGLFCNSVNLLTLDSLKKIMKWIGNEIEPRNVDKKEKIQLIVDSIKSTAEEAEIVLELRK